MNIKSLVIIKEKEIQLETIKITKKTKLWCKLPYSNHKDGCPNYNRNLLCPPISPYFKEIINVYNYFYLIYAIFNFLLYKELRKEEYPLWSKKRVKCVLYWQSSIKKLLKEHIKRLYETNHTRTFYLLSCGSGFSDKLLNKFQSNIYSMESVGIDVFQTLRNNNINFELKPRNKILLVCLLCSKIELNKGMF